MRSATRSAALPRCAARSRINSTFSVANLPGADMVRMRDPKRKTRHLKNR